MSQASPALRGQQRGSPEPRRGERHLWLPRGLGNPAILLALAIDTRRGHPDNASATARFLGVDRKTVRRWRSHLLAEQLIYTDDGRLCPTDLGRQALQGSDPVPRPLLHGKGPKPTPEQLRAVAVVYADALGLRAHRPGCRSDRERAQIAAVSLPTVRKARQILSDSGLVTVESLKRGRTSLRRVKLTEDRRATHGSPLSGTRAIRLAQAAERGRRGGTQIARRGGAQIVSPHKNPKGFSTHRNRGTDPAVPASVAAVRPAAAPQQVEQQFASLDGWRPSAAPSRRGEAQGIGEILAALPLAGPAVQKRGASKRTEVAVQRLVMLTRGDRLEDLLGAPPTLACEQVLDIVGVHNLSRRQRQALAHRVARGLGVVRLVMLAADVLLSSVRSPGAVLAARIRRALDGEPAPSLITRRRAQWEFGEFLEALELEAA